MPDYKDETRFSWAKALDEGHDTYAVKFTKWQEHHPTVGRDRVVRMSKPSPSDFFVTPQFCRSGMVWWHVHRRLNPNDQQKEWRWCGRFPFAEEASGYIEDTVAGRERVYFNGIRFDKHPLPPPKLVT